jgi:transposase
MAPRRHQALSQIAGLDAALEELVTRAAPQQFLAAQGIAAQTTTTLLTTIDDNAGRKGQASSAALCGVSPVDASPAYSAVTALTAEATGTRTPRCGRSS